MKGILALDIDGTLTDDFHFVPAEVVAYLAKLAKEWQIFFVTGRSFQWAHAAVENMPFPYYFAVQNGALILKMPSQKIVSKQYLDCSIFAEMDKICADEPTDYVIYSGFENDDICYFRPSRFSPYLLTYLQKRVAALREFYQPVESFLTIPSLLLPSVKCFGVPESARRIAAKMQIMLGLHVSAVSDPFDDQFMVAQATHPNVSKGRALETVKSFYASPPIIISAGNDYNDESMFAASDIRIVMGNAPADLFKQADIIAPSVKEMGIIKGLSDAIASLNI